MAAEDITTQNGAYSVRQVSDMLNLSASQIRTLVADGTLTPKIGERGKFLFSFQDLVLLRSVADLVRSGVAPHRVMTAVAILRDQLPDDALLAEVSLDASGQSVVASIDATSWEPVSGQTVLNLDGGAVTIRIASVVDAPPPSSGRRTATEWYVIADEVESSDPLAAEDAYRRAIEIDETFADAHLNLGRLLHAAGAVHDALEEYLAARTLDSDDATTHYNVGVAFQDLGDLEEAVTAYEQAIELAPRFADARFNLAGLYEELGNEKLAVQHLREYKELLDGR
jgi:DNA-binding transcriptional MerR regulator